MTIAIASQKGGTGKTTTSISLAAGLARLHKKRVLLIDLDSQANSSKVLISDYAQLAKEQTTYTTILEEQPLQIHDTGIPRLKIVPSHILLSETDMMLSGQMFGGQLRLKNELDKVREQFDYVFIDCPPALSWLTINAFTASNRVLVPLSPGYFELDSVAQINRTIAKVVNHYNPSLALAGYLFTMGDPTRNSIVSLELLRDTFKDQVFKTIIPRNTAIRDAHFKHVDIFEHAPTSKAAQAYRSLIKELYGDV